MWSAVDIAVLVASLGCGVGALITALLAYRRQAVLGRKGQWGATLAQLKEWRHAELLVMSDQDFQWAVEMGKDNPRQLESLVGAIQRLIDREEFGPEDAIMLEVKVEYEESMAPPKADSPKGHLELIAAFG